MMFADSDSHSADGEIWPYKNNFWGIKKNHPPYISFINRLPEKQKLSIFYKRVFVFVPFFINDSMDAFDGSRAADFKQPGAAHCSGLSRG